jgi:hypothetical protein
MSLTVFFSETCPKCHKPITQAVIKQHPARPDCALQNFECADCGVVKTRIYSLKPGEPPPELAA